MTNILKDLVLDEVSLVDIPANPLAEVPLFKRHKGNDMDNEDIKKKAEELEAEVATLKSEKATLEEEVTTLKGQLAEKVEVEKKDEMIDFDGVKVAKSAIPEVVLKKLEAVEKAAEEADLRKRADEVIPHFTGDIAKRAKLIKSVGGDEDLMALLRAADALFAATTQEIGKQDANADLKSAKEKLNDIAKAYAAEKKTDFYKAYAEVIKTDEGKELVKQTYKE
jgi:hypothetical protein